MSKIPFYKKREVIRKESLQIPKASTPFIVYDLSIEDLQERKVQAKRFDCAKELSNYLSIRVQNIPYYTSTEAIRKKRRYFSEIHNREFAIRIDIQKFKDKNT